MNKISLLSYNVNGLRDEKKRRKIFNYLHEHKFTIVCMQETHSSEEVEKVWSNEWGGKIFFAHGTSNSKGTAILFNRQIDVEVKDII